MTKTKTGRGALKVTRVPSGEPPVTVAAPEGADVRGADGSQALPAPRNQLSDGRRYDKLAGARPDRPKDIGKFVRALFEHHKFSAIEDLVVMAMNPPEDMKTSDRIAVLKHLSEYEAPKAKSESLVQQGAQAAGIQVTVVQFGSQTQVREKLPPDAYKEFMPKVGEEDGQ